MINDRGTVSAYLEDASGEAGRARILSADQRRVHRHPRRGAQRLDASPSAAAAGSRFGAAVTIAKAGGATRADRRLGAGRRGDGRPRRRLAQLDGDQRPRTIGPFGGASTMAVALAASVVGAAAAGVAIVTIEANTSCSTGENSVIRTTGLVSVEAASVLTADVDADGGAIATVRRVGTMIAEAKIGDGATIGRTRATIGAGGLDAGSNCASRATNTSTGDRWTWSPASGGIFAGDGGSATATVKPKITAAIDPSAVVGTSRDLQVEATSIRAEGNSSAKSSGGGGLKIGVIFATTTATPTVRATVGAGAVLIAGGGITVKAQALSQATDANAFPETFTPTQAQIDADTIVFANHGLTTGDRVTYTAGTSAIPLAGGSTLDVCGASACREYGAIVVDKDTIRLGERFTPTAADTGGAFPATAGVDAARDVIRFATAAHVRLRRPGPLHGRHRRLGPRPVHHLLRARARRLHDRPAHHVAAATAGALAITSASGDTITRNGHGLNNGDAVTYAAPAPVVFTGQAVNAQPNPAFDKNNPSSQPLTTTCGNLCTNTIFLGRDTNNDGTIDTGHGFNSGDIVDYVTLGSRIVGSLGTYYVISVDANTVALADSACHAGIGTYDPTPGSSNHDDDNTSCTTNIVRLSLTRPAIAGDRDRPARAHPPRARLAQLGRDVLRPRRERRRQQLQARRVAGRRQPGALGQRHRPQRRAHDPPRGRRADAGHVRQVQARAPHRLPGHRPGRRPPAARPGRRLAAHDPRARGRRHLLGDHRGRLGGGITIAVPTSAITANPDVQAYISGGTTPTRIEAGAGVELNAKSVTEGTAYTSNFGIGGVAAGEVDASVDITATTKAYIGADGVHLRAAGALRILSDTAVPDLASARAPTASASAPARTPSRTRGST